MNTPMYMIAGITANGWQGNTNSTTPASNTEQIDYVRAWSSMPTAAQEAAVPTGTTGTSGISGTTPPVVVSPTTVTVASSQASFTTAVNLQTINATGGSHAFF